jgi:hypothetical protein
VRFSSTPKISPLHFAVEWADNLAAVLALEELHRLNPDRPPDRASTSAPTPGRPINDEGVGWFHISNKHENFALSPCAAQIFCTDDGAMLARAAMAPAGSKPGGIGRRMRAWLIASS